MTSRFHPDQLQPGDTVWYFRVVRRLGSGGFSTVFLVERDGRPFTMKLAARPPSTGGEDENTTDERAYREAVTLGLFRHPNLPRVFEIGRWPDANSGYFFIIIEYIPSCTLNEWRWRTQAPLRRLVEKVAELTLVLTDLHARGVIHRDLKADNILIRDGDEKLYLMDFGAAYLPGGYTLTQVLPPSTLHNLPPECATFLINGEWEQGVKLPADPVMDLYCIGALLYEVLTDCHPFNPRLPQPELLVAIESVVPKQPMRLDPRVPRALNDLTMRLLAKNPEERPATAQALLDELMQLLEAEGDSEHWTRPYGFEGHEPAPAAPPAEEKLPEASSPAEQAEDKEQKPRERGRQWRAPLALCLLGVALGIGWGLLRVGCTAAYEVACADAGSTEKGLSPVFPSSKADTSLRSKATSGLCMWLGACAAATNLLACASAPVRPEMEPLLEQCSPESRETASRLGLKPIMQVQLVNVTCAAPKDICNAVNVRSGPIEGELILKDEEYVKVTGKATVFPDRLYIFFDQLYPTPEGEPVAFCGAAVDDSRDRFGVTTSAAYPVLNGVNIDPAMVDRSPEATVINFPIVFTYVQGPTGKFQPRRIGRWP